MSAEMKQSNCYEAIGLWMPEEGSPLANYIHHEAMVYKVRRFHLRGKANGYATCKSAPAGPEFMLSRESLLKRANGMCCKRCVETALSRVGHVPHTCYHLRGAVCNTITEGRARFIVSREGFDLKPLKHRCRWCEKWLYNMQQNG